MPLYEYHCDDCDADFEQLTSERDPDQGKCPKCHKNHTHRLISKFRVGGQGDLRESTWDGCHAPGSLSDGSDDGHHDHHDHNHHGGHGPDGSSDEN
ncbi:MAG: zinc ribbon domain-containing protein [Oligoflexia bacterium]|nr:zinc ribbon domain-containing protein [Oligoflexia bacterium]